MYYILDENHQPVATSFEQMMKWGFGTILFETKVFNGVMDDSQVQYCTWDEAVEGHKEMVERVTEAEINKSRD